MVSTSRQHDRFSPFPLTDVHIINTLAHAAAQICLDRMQFYAICLGHDPYMKSIR